MESSKSKINLKDPLAQKLLNEKVVVIDGIELNLWTGHTFNTINTQNTWNKIESYTSLNSKVINDIGSIVFTGAMQVTRKEAAEFAICLGFKVHNNISRKTDYIVVGSENVSPTKIATSIELNEKGANIQLIDEITFLQLVENNFDLIESSLVEFVDEPKDILDNESTKEIINESIISFDENNFAFPNLLQAKAFVVSGKFSVSRDDIKQMISNYGGKVISAISSKTDYVLAGDKMGPAKLKKAEKLNIAIISEDEFYKMINN